MLIVARVVERLRRLLLMAYGALGDSAGCSLGVDRLKIVAILERRSDRVWTAVAGDALHSVVTDGVAEELARLLVLVPWLVVTGSAPRFFDPRFPGRIADSGHRLVTFLAGHSRGFVYVAETLRHRSRVA